MSVLGYESYGVACWNCLGEFDALTAVWCSDDPKNPTKLCPFCLRCFCEASEKYKREFWGSAPARLREELQTLARSRDRLGDVLIRMGKLTTPQLLEAIGEQRRTGKLLGEVLVERGVVHPDDIQAALKSQGVRNLPDTAGSAYPSSNAVWAKTSPAAVVDAILGLGARKGASDVQLEPKEDQIAVKYRIDGFFFRVEPIPKSLQQAITERLFTMFQLDPARAGEPQSRRRSAALPEGEYDLILQTLPTVHGVSATLKLVNRATFLKDFTTLGLELDDRIRLIEELKGAFGLVLVSAPVFNGANTTAYSIMSFLVQGQRDVVSLESPVHWPLEGARQVDVGTDAGRVHDALRSVSAVRPEVLVLSAVPDRATARLAAQLASSVLVIVQVPAQCSVEAVRSFVELGAPLHLVAGTFGAATAQRLVRQICPGCKEPAVPPARQTLAQHGIDPGADLAFFRGRGCPACNTVGYRGRRAIFEVLTGTMEVRAGVASGVGPKDLESLGRAAGMTTLRDRCLRLVADGVTTFEEFTRLRL